jgi:putative PIG3 family NAD(P)H quinone oxidoreductase
LAKLSQGCQLVTVQFVTSLFKPEPMAQPPKTEIRSIAMRAVVLREKGGPEVLQIENVPDPTIGAEEVLIAVVSTAVNRADTLQRMGLYPGPDSEYEIPGLEYSGRVVAVGERVTTRQIGDEVMGIVAGGAYAEFVATHERTTLPVPSSVSVADAGAIPEVFITAWDALVVQGGLASGRTALVHAGASGVGTAAIQIAKALGAKIIVTASSGKVAACTALGADLAIDYTQDDFVDGVNEFTNGVGVDVVLDVIGGDYFVRNIACLRTQGSIIQVGVIDPSPVTFSLLHLLPKRATVTGTVLRARPLEEKILTAQRFGREILPRFDDGSLRPVIDSRMPLDQIADAHRRMGDNANIGKIVIDVA